jgi:hypothetical protein
MVHYDDLEMAFDFVSSDQPFMNEAVVNIKTGKIFYKSDLTGTDEFPEDADSDDYAAIPHKNDLDLGRDLVFDFTAKHLAQKSETVARIFSRRGAYREFKALLESLGLMETWYKFEAEQTKTALRKWCQENNLEIDT